MEEKSREINLHVRYTDRSDEDIATIDLDHIEDPKQQYDIGDEVKVKSGDKSDRYSLLRGNPKHDLDVAREYVTHQQGAPCRAPIRLSQIRYTSFCIFFWTADTHTHIYLRHHHQGH